MKKTLSILMALVLALSLAACGTSTNSGSESESTPDALPAPPETHEPTAPIEPVPPESEEDGTDFGNVLVAYYSHTGNTEEIAQLIAEQTGGDLAEIQRSQPYGDLEAEAEEELNSDARPEITMDVDSVEPYDVIFVGYPIWWNEAPAMIATFLENNDFDGKTIVPFCTSASDRIDNSLHIFDELTDGVTILEGLTANDLDDLGPWLDMLSD